MPLWFDKFLIRVFGGSTDVDDTDSPKGDHRAEDAIAMDTLRRRASSGSQAYLHNQRAPGFDYIHWKPYGKRRRRQIPNEYIKQCRHLSGYVASTAYAGYLGLEEKRWAGIGLEPAPLGTKRAPGTGPPSLSGSRDILSKMGPGPAR